MIQIYRNLTCYEMRQIDRENTIVIVPIGALEQHGNQAPLGTDAMIAEGTLRRLQEQLPDEIPVLLFPVLPIGLSTEHRNF